MQASSHRSGGEGSRSHVERMQHMETGKSTVCLETFLLERLKSRSIFLMSIEQCCLYLALLTLWMR